MSVDELPDYLRQHGWEIRAQLVTGGYRPRAVRRVETPKPDGCKRWLGIPTVLDRFIQFAQMRDRLLNDAPADPHRTHQPPGPMHLAVFLARRVAQIHEHASERTPTPLPRGKVGTTPFRPSRTMQLDDSVHASVTKIPKTRLQLRK